MMREFCDAGGEPQPAFRQDEVKLVDGHEQRLTAEGKSIPHVLPSLCYKRKLCQSSELQLLWQSS